MEQNLVITNYDNFKDLSYFIEQHNKALEMIKEVENFYLSFLKSKLIYSYDIDKYPGFIVNKVYPYNSKKDKISLAHKGFLCNGNDKWLDWDEAIEGAHLKDPDGFWFVIEKIKIKKNPKHMHDIYGPEEKEIWIKYDEPKYEYGLMVDVHYMSKGYKYKKTIKKGYYHSETKITNQELYDKEEALEKESWKLKDQLETLDFYNNQQLAKKLVCDFFKKINNEVYYIVDTKTSRFKEFSTENKLKEFKFKFSDDKKRLIVYTENYSSGTRKDRWKTFEYKGRVFYEYHFDVNTGNFIENKHYMVKDFETELNVSNGWHPFDDD